MVYRTVILNILNRTYDSKLNQSPLIQTSSHTTESPFPVRNVRIMTIQTVETSNRQNRFEKFQIISLVRRRF